MAVVNPPIGLQNAGATHSAAILRTALAGLQAGQSTSASLRSRGGVHPTLGVELGVQQTGSPSMAVEVFSGVASIPGTESSTQGNYIVTNDATVTLSITTAHATLPRIDIVVFNVRDQVYSGSSNDSQLQVIAGTPASSPVAPSPPVNSITLAQVAVGAAVSSITNANITDTRFYLAGAGGIIPARSEASRPASTEISESQVVYTMDNNKLWLWDGSAYNQLFPSYDKIGVNILSGTSANINFPSISQNYTSLRLLIMCRGDTAAAFTTVRIRFNSDTGANYDSEQDSAVGTTVAAFEALNATGADIGEATASTAVAGSVAVMDVIIPWYTNSTFWKTLVSNHMLQAQTSGGASGALHSKRWSSRWRNTAAITSIDIFPAAGNFISGSSFALYGNP